MNDEKIINKIDKPITKMISIRIPEFLYYDLKKVCEKYPHFTMSRLIVFATTKDIQRYLKGD